MQPSDCDIVDWSSKSIARLHRVMNILVVRHYTEVRKVEIKMYEKHQFSMTEMKDARQSAEAGKPQV